jgi:hypothetical protein
MPHITDPQRAERLARAVLSDVMLYNVERVRAGIEADDLFDRLRPRKSTRPARSSKSESTPTLRPRATPSIAPS